MKYLISSRTYLRAPAGQGLYVEPGKQEVNCSCPVVSYACIQVLMNKILAVLLTNLSWL